MSDMFDYLAWRGDILFSELTLNAVDALIFSALSYVNYEGIVSDKPHGWITLEEAAEQLLMLPDIQKRIRVKKDIELLKTAAGSERFRKVGLSYYQNIFIPEEETQFAAITFYPGDGTAFLAFRGTDNTITGWKEDFNMSFQDSVPAQRLALQYAREFSGFNDAPFRMGGHSKGGNLAVYAAAKCEPDIQSRILDVYNQDGPGFRTNLMGDSGYQSMVPKIHTYVPQSSLIGMLMEHEEPFIVIKSKSVGVMQHEPYSWEVLGKDFILMKEITANSQFMNKVIKNWLAEMSIQERDKFFDTVFELLDSGDAEYTHQIVQPKNVAAYLKTLGSDEEMRRFLAKELVRLISAAGRNREEKERWSRILKKNI